MISDQDIKKLEKTFVTKTEFKKLDKKVDGIQEELGGLKEEVGDLRIEVGEIKDKLDSLEINILDKFDILFGAIQDIRDDNAAGAATMARHTVQIQALATHTGMTLPD